MSNKSRNSIQLTAREADALLEAIGVYEDTYIYDEDMIDSHVRQTLKALERIESKLQSR